MNKNEELSQIRDRLARDVEEFLAKGKQISEIPSGVSAESILQGRHPFVLSNKDQRAR